MGFDSVYKALVEVFPQIDSRILRAVAIEHSKDADVAVEVVLVEVIPSLDYSNKFESSIGLSEVAVDGGKTVQHEATMDPVAVISSSCRLLTKAGPSETDGRLPDATGVVDTGLSGQTDHSTVVEPIASGSLVISSYHDAIGVTNNDSDGLPMPLEKCEDNSNIDPDSASSASICEGTCFDNNDQRCVEIRGDNVALLGESVVTDAGLSEEETALQLDVLGISSYHDAIGETNTVSDGLPIPLENCEDSSNTGPSCAPHASICEGVSFDNSDQICVEIRGDNVASLGEFEVTDVGFSEEEVAPQLDVTTPVAKDKYHNLHVDTEMVIDPASSHLVGITPESDLNSSFKTTSEKGASVFELVNSEDESMMTSTLVRSVCSTELLEDIIEDARNSKKIIASTMDSVVNLMKEVEFQEKAAKQAKMEAEQDCSGIVEKVDELKEALRRAKEANDMHAGEVYAEKAILATELKELQLRLFTLSDERDQSLQILDDMRRALEIRLAAALGEIKAAEAEKMEKEESAREALAYQESQMEMVVKESKKLKLEAEENSKLHDFLVDRGRAIDMLKGEISVKCQDVKLLKEKFVKRIPLSRSLSSSQTSSILASSGSSFRSTVTPPGPEPEPEPETYGTPKSSAEVGDSYGFLEKVSRSGLGPSPKSSKETKYSIDDSFPSGEEKHDDDRKLILDDDWELFDKDDWCLNA